MSQLPPPEAPSPSAPRTTDAGSIASLVAGILAVLSSIVCLGLILGPVAVILGVIALIRTRSLRRGASFGLALAGLILGVVAMLASGWILYGAWHYCSPGYPCEG